MVFVHPWDGWDPNFNHPWCRHGHLALRGGWHHDLSCLLGTCVAAWEQLDRERKTFMVSEISGYYFIKNVPYRSILQGKGSGDAISKGELKLLACIGMRSSDTQLVFDHLKTNTCKTGMESLRSLAFWGQRHWLSVKVGVPSGDRASVETISMRCAGQRNMWKSIEQLKSMEINGNRMFRGVLTGALIMLLTHELAWCSCAFSTFWFLDTSRSEPWSSLWSTDWQLSDAQIFVNASSC